jgi:hypothetical protein
MFDLQPLRHTSTLATFRVRRSWDQRRVSAGSRHLMLALRTARRTELLIECRKVPPAEQDGAAA